MITLSELISSDEKSNAWMYFLGKILYFYCLFLGIIILLYLALKLFK